ncbi:hypothetical protein SDRG_11245 [Saprolegnia diclina VS20]|uniref:Prefoldin, alpha subunit n=1 Tax=Saprolegnia diclina (strain VS20) TaxID=1156394 RepID=T0PZR2_SAPDV|nr:hypothetical protein SDRG_11245 [Saprolegnia diclina VS20]EQC31059.1 hypothetical protein SDRG_11245 [Saprolegnia diclina VS20]|eukprot:XP_008615498.1 hypothetical protein SDRG_11245 [Saprolegnia diclina VS20]
MATAEVEKYATFVEETLRPQLTAALAQRDALDADVAEYDNLVEMLAGKAAADAQDKAWKLQCDLGKQCYAKVKVAPHTPVVVHIGLQVYVEMAAADVPPFVAGRKQFLAAKRERHQAKAREIASHIQQVLDAVEALARLQSATPE